MILRGRIIWNFERYTTGPNENVHDTVGQSYFHHVTDLQELALDPIESSLAHFILAAFCRWKTFPTWAVC